MAHSEAFCYSSQKEPRHLIIREMHIKSTIRYQLMLTRMTSIFKKPSKQKPKPQKTSVGEEVETLEVLRTVGGNVKWDSRCGEQYGGSSKS